MTTNEVVTIGVIGAQKIVRRIMTIAHEMGNLSWRVVAGVYAHESQAPERARRLDGRVDVYLFAGPFPYDISMANGGLSAPATYVPVGGPALFGTLLRGALAEGIDPLRVTVDSVAADDLRTAYEEVGLDPAGVRVHEYLHPDSVQEFYEFHRACYERGESTGAVTSVPSVAARLPTAGVPTLMMAPTHQTIRQALHTAALMGSGARLEESRIVTMVARMPSTVVPVRAGAGNYGYQERKLALHRELLRDARLMDAAVLPRDTHSYLVVTTMGSLSLVTEGLTVAPFLDRVHRELGFWLELGIGWGRSAREAEAHAAAAVDKAALAAPGTAYLIGPHNAVLRLPAAHARGSVAASSAPAEDVDHAARSESTPLTSSRDALARLKAKLERSELTDLIVDADRVAKLLGTTRRTARRVLRNLVDDGLAWPVPPPRSNRVGRPPQPYQLLNVGYPKTPEEPADRSVYERHGERG